VPRFALLRHDHPAEHWDFFLEDADALRSWRLAARPALGEVISAEQMADHRKVYLDYEGPVSGGRGHVVREDAGEFDWLTDGPGTVLLAVHGQWLTGEIRLSQVGAAWRFHWPH